MLRVHECRRDVSSHRVDTASKEHAVGDDVPVLARAHRPPDFPGQLFADQVARMSGAKSGTSPWARMRLWRASGAIYRLCLEQNPDIAISAFKRASSNALMAHPGYAHCLPFRKIELNSQERASPLLKARIESPTTVLGATARGSSTRSVRHRPRAEARKTRTMTSLTLVQPWGPLERSLRRAFAYATKIAKEHA